MGLYDRQEKFELKTDIVPVVIGCGGVGFHVAKMLAMAGVENIVLFDNDIVEEHNLSRLDLPLSVIGLNKTEAIKLLVNQMRPECNVQAFGYRFNPDVLDTLTVDVTHIIDCTDQHAVQLENQAFAGNKGYKYMKIGYDFTHITIGNSIAEWDSGDSQDGYTIIPSYCVTAMVVAGLAVNKILTNSDEELSANLEDLYIGYK
jgi:hypothetical protein